MRHVIRTIATLLALLLTGALVAPPGHAAPTWLPVVDLSAAGTDAADPKVAVDAAGNAVAVWRYFDGTHNLIQASRRPASGAWSAPTTISAPGQNAHSPMVDVDDHGNATAAWVRSDGFNSRVQAATLPVGGPWSTPVTLSPGGSDGLWPDLSVAAGGTAVLAWYRYDGSHYRIQATIRTALGDWGAPETLSEAGQSARYPTVASSGDVTIVAWQRSDGAWDRVQSSTRVGNGDWSVPATHSDTGQHAGTPQLAVDPAGNAALTWSRSDGAHHRIQASTRAVGGAWSIASTLSESGGSASSPRVTVVPSGPTLVVWERHDGANQRIQVSTQPPGGAWSAPVNLSAAGHDALWPAVSASSSGVVAVWGLVDGGNFLVQARRATSGGVWAAPTTLSAAGQSSYFPDVAVDSTGNAAAVWFHYNGTHFIVQAAGLDHAGPVVTGFTAPASGQAGQSLAFTASGTDVWSAVSGIGWDFGDGGTATGGSVAHTYAAPGSYTVTATLTDAVGNTSTRAATVTISATPVPPPPPPPPTPTITTFTLKPGKIRAVGSTTRGVTAKTKVTVVLNAAAKTTLVFKKKGARKPAARLSKSLAAGKNTFKISAKIKKKVLKPGTYKVTAKASNPAGDSAPRKAKLTVVR